MLVGLVFGMHLAASSLAAHCFVRFGGLLAAAVCTWMGRREDTIPIAFLFSSFSAGRGERVLVDSVCCRCALGSGGWGVRWSQRGGQGRLSGEGRDVNIKHKTKDMGTPRTYPKMRKSHPFVVLCRCVEVKSGQPARLRHAKGVV